MNRRSPLLAAGWSLVTLGLLVAVAGVAVGMLAVRADGAFGTSVSCGTALSPRHDEAQANQLAGNLGNAQLGLPADRGADVCTGPLHSRRGVTFALLGGGGGLAVVAVAGLVVPGAVTRPRTAP